FAGRPGEGPGRDDPVGSQYALALPVDDDGPDRGVAVASGADREDDVDPAPVPQPVVAEEPPAAVPPLVLGLLGQQCGPVGAPDLAAVQPSPGPAERVPAQLARLPPQDPDGQDAQFRAERGQDEQFHPEHSGVGPGERGEYTPPGGGQAERGQSGRRQQARTGEGAPPDGFTAESAETPAPGLGVTAPHEQEDGRRSGEDRRGQGTGALPQEAAGH